MGDGVAHLGPQVALRARHRLEQGGVLGGGGQDFVDKRAVAAEQVLDVGLGEVVAAGQRRDLVGQGVVAVGAEDRGLLGDGLRHLGAQLLSGQVHRVLTNDAVGGVLATGHGNHARGYARHGVVAGEVGGGVGFTGQQRAQAGVDTNDVLAGDLVAHALVDLVQDVVNIRLGRGRIRQGQALLPVGIGGADDPVLAPRDDKQHGLLGDEAQGGLGIEGVLRHDDVHTLGGVDGELTLGASHLLNLVVPHAGGVDEDLAADGGLAAGLEVTHVGGGDAAARVLLKAGDLGAGAHAGAVLGGGAQDSHGVAGVVDQRVVVAHATDDCVFLQARGHLEHALAGEVLLHRDTLGAAHEVIQSEAAEHHDALPAAVGQREDELQRLDQVRGQGGHVELALLEGLRHQAEVKHGQVAQAAVEHLGGAGRGTGGEVAGLEHGGLQTAGSGVDGSAGTDGTPADDHYVIVLSGVVVPGLLKVVGVETVVARRGHG